MTNEFEEQCSKCNGDGNIMKEDGPYVCRHCRGTGKVNDWVEQATGKTNFEIHRTPILELGVSTKNNTVYSEDSIFTNQIRDKELALRLKLMLGV